MEAIMEQENESLESQEDKQDPSQFRNLIKQVSGKDISTREAANFLEIFEEDLKAELTAVRRSFIRKHFGDRNSQKQ